jgi:deoxyribose-phosphate aldolase
MNNQSTYNLTVDETRMKEKLDSIISRAEEIREKELFRKLFSLIDLTSLNIDDTDKKILQLIHKVNRLPERYNEIPNVAALCVYPAFIPLLRENLIAPGVQKASVAASFPNSMTFIEVKLDEIKRVIKAGADEIDIVFPVGKFLEGKFEQVLSELKSIKKATGAKTLKVILETAILEDPVKIKHASFIALDAGADFIKTSTGKNGKGASAEAVFVMCESIKEYHATHHRMAGIKPAGGISDATTAVMHYLIVNEVLGNEWLQPSRFRIGASKLANHLLGDNYF